MTNTISFTSQTNFVSADYAMDKVGVIVNDLFSTNLKRLCEETGTTMGELRSQHPTIKDAANALVDFIKSGAYDAADDTVLHIAISIVEKAKSAMVLRDIPEMLKAVCKSGLARASYCRSYWKNETPAYQGEIDLWIGDAIFDVRSALKREANNNPNLEWKLPFNQADMEQAIGHSAQLKVVDTIEDWQATYSLLPQNYGTNPLGFLLMTLPDNLIVPVTIINPSEAKRAVILHPEYPIDKEEFAPVVEALDAFIRSQLIDDDHGDSAPPATTLKPVLRFTRDDRDEVDESTESETSSDTESAYLKELWEDAKIIRTEDAETDPESFFDNLHGTLISEPAEEYEDDNRPRRR